AFADAGSHSTQLWFEIWVPRQSDVDLVVAGGSIDVDNVSGSVSGQTGGGKVHMRDIIGVVSFYTGGGEITVRDSHVDGTVTTGWGGVNIQNVQGNLRGVSSGGADARGDATRMYA